MIKIACHVLGPLFNNTYLLSDLETKQAVVIDPAFDPDPLLRDIHKNKWQVVGIWLTHAHFDHFAGLANLVRSIEPVPPIGLHHGDLDLYHAGGLSENFGIPMPVLPEPMQLFSHKQIISLGQTQIEVRHTPGHSPGHVIFYIPMQAILFSGDLIFHLSVGRTDLPGGNFKQLLDSINNQVMDLPPETCILNGHGPETTVGEEMHGNPFL